MTVDEFIDFCEVQAKALQSRMLELSPRRPKEFMYQTPDGSTYTIFFQGCPYKLKSEGMVWWLQMLFIWSAFNEMYKEVRPSLRERVEMALHVFIEELERNVWVFDPYGSITRIQEVLEELEDWEFATEAMLAVWMKIDEVLSEGKFPEKLEGDYYLTMLLCNVFMVKNAIKMESEAVALNLLAPLRELLASKLEEARVEDERPDLEYEWDRFEMLIGLLPEIEVRGKMEVYKQVLEFARDFYGATDRRELSQRYADKLRDLEK